MPPAETLSSCCDNPYCDRFFQGLPAASSASAALAGTGLTGTPRHCSSMPQDRFRTWAGPSSWTASLSADGSPGQEQLSEFTGNPLADVDQDGVIAIMEYLGGLSDLVASPEGLPMFEIINDGGSDYLAITFRRDPRASDVEHFIEVSEDLETWSGSEASELVTLVKTTTDGDGVPRHTYRLNVPMDGTSRQFIRLGVRY